MKNILAVIVLSLFVVTALNAFAFNGSHDEAVAYIEKATFEDPEIQEWVKGKFGSQEVFLSAVKVAPDDTVQQIAGTFQDFQQHGGDLETAAQAAVWVYIVLAIATVIVLALVF